MESHFGTLGRLEHCQGQMESMLSLVSNGLLLAKIYLSFCFAGGEGPESSKSYRLLLFKSNS